MVKFQYLKELVDWRKLEKAKTLVEGLADENSDIWPHILANECTDEEFIDSCTPKVWRFVINSGLGPFLWKRMLKLVGQDRWKVIISSGLSSRSTSQGQLNLHS